MDPLPPLPTGAKLITQPAALPPLPQGATMLTTHKAPAAPTGPVDMGDPMAPPSEGEQILRGAYSPIDALLTLFEHQLGATGGAVASLGARAVNAISGADIPGPNGQTPSTALNPDAIRSTVSNALGGNKQAVTSQGQSIVDAPGRAAAAINQSAPGQTVNAAVAALAQKYPNIAAFLSKAAPVAGDVANTVGAVAGGEGLGATDEGLAASKAAATPPPVTPITDPVEQLKTAGFQIPTKAEDIPAARQANGDVVTELARRASGLTPDQALTTAALNDAKKPHNAVLSQVESDLGPAVPVGTDPQFQAAVANAGSTPGTLTPKNAAIDSLKTQALENPTLSGQQIGANIRQMRDSGYRNLDSDDDGTQALGRTQLDIARAHEDLIDQNLPADSDISLADLQGARQQLAKINMVQRNLVGENVNPIGVAREARNNPAVNGELRLIANLQDHAPQVAGLPQRAPIQQGVVPALATAAAGAGIGGMVHGPMGALVGGALGGHGLVPATLDALKAAFRSAPAVPEDLSAAGLGNLFTRGNGLEPGWNRTPQLELTPSPGGPPITPYQPDLGFGGSSAPPNGTLPPGARVGGPTTVPEPQGGLSLADEIAQHAAPENNSQLGHVMSQGVPEDIMSRTPHAGGVPLSLEPSQAQGAGFAMNPVSAEPKLGDILEGLHIPNAGYTPPANLPKGEPLKIQGHRGVPAGADASDSSQTVVPGTLMYKDNPDDAEFYAGAGGNVVSKALDFKNALNVGTLPQTIAQLGLSPHSGIADVISAAKAAGYDGLRYTLGGMKNDVEIVDLNAPPPPKGK